MGKSVFLNILYDREFEHLFPAYVAGLVSLGLIPRPSLALGNSQGRLDKIIHLIDECAYSVHDLSRIQLSTENDLPRFNMPLELGLAIYRTHREPHAHDFVIFEEKAYRLQQSASDLNGFDPYIHNGSENELLSKIRDAFFRENRDRTVPEMLKVLRALKKKLPGLKKNAGVQSLFEGSAICNETIAVATILSEQQGLFQPQ